MNHQPALVLNTDGTCLKVISWKRAICLAIIGKEIPGEGVTVIKYYEDYVTSAGGMHIPVPAVVMTNRYINVSKKIPLTKTNLMARDNEECQYCGVKLNGSTATVDHVIPKKRFKSKIDAHRWDNVVISCRTCNIKKGARTPEEAKMPLRKKPRMVDKYNFFPVKKRPEWEEFLGYN